MVLTPYLSLQIAIPIRGIAYNHAWQAPVFPNDSKSFLECPPTFVAPQYYYY
jgi:hypothetical protein